MTGEEIKGVHSSRKWRSSGEWEKEKGKGVGKGRTVLSGCLGGASPLVVEKRKRFFFFYVCLVEAGVLLIEQQNIEIRKMHFNLCNELGTPFNNQKSLFTLPTEEKNDTALSKYIWSPKKTDIEFLVLPRIFKWTQPFSDKTQKCNPSTFEKYFLILKPQLCRLKKTNSYPQAEMLPNSSSTNTSNSSTRHLLYDGCLIWLCYMNAVQKMSSSNNFFIPNKCRQMWTMVKLRG